MLDKIVHAEVHRLVITDDEQRVIGIISLSDILDALVIRPHGTAPGRARWDGTGRDGTGRDGTGRDGMGRDRRGRGASRSGKHEKRSVTGRYELKCEGIEVNEGMTLMQIMCCSCGLK